MSITSPHFVSVQPLALLTSRLGSISLTHLVSRSVSYCPQPSLKTTHMMMAG